MPLAESKSSLLDRYLILLLLLFSAYAALFIYRTSFVIDGERYFCLFDDAMISMRYADNLAHHQGLVWNPGEKPVEGFTNPLWVFYMAMLHRIPLPRSKICLLVQLSGMLLLMANLVLVWSLARSLSGGSRGAALCASGLTAFYLPLNNWGLQGTEVSLLTLVMSAQAWMAVRYLNTGRWSGPLYLLLGLATLIRPDMAVPAVLILAFLAVVDAPRRARHALTGAIPLVLVGIAQTLFRLYYFNDLLPNTYYLKLTGYPLLPRMTRGALVTVKFLVEMNPLLLALALALIILRRDRRLTLLGLIFAGQLAYNVYVGGDAWEWWGGSNRYLSVAMPLFFVVLVCALDYCAHHVFRTLADQSGITRRLGAGGILAGFTMIALLGLNVAVGRSNGPGVESEAIAYRYPFEELLLLEKPLHVPDNQIWVRAGLLVRRTTDPEATIAVGAAGAIPYFAQRRAIDLFGKNDRKIAREDAAVPQGWAKWISFYPGHDKSDYDYSIGELKPDVIMEQVPAYLEQDYIRVQTTVEAGSDAAATPLAWRVRKDSTHIRPYGNHGDPP